jgi:hypothetical protein
VKMVEMDCFSTFGSCVLAFEISYRVIIYLEDGFWFHLEDFFEDYIYFCSFHNSSFCLEILLNVNGKATQCDTPLIPKCFQHLHSFTSQPHVFIANEIDHNKSGRSIEKGTKKCTNSAPQQHFMN